MNSVKGKEMIRNVTKETIRQILLNESVILPKVVYRGIFGKYDGSYKQNITWVSSTKEYSEVYTDGSGEIVAFSFTKKPYVLDFGFRTADTEVKFSDVVDRMNVRLSEDFRSGKISKAKAFEVMDVLDALDFNGFKRVFEWVNFEPLIKAYRVWGIDAVILREGNHHAGNVVTFGVINKSILRKL